MKLSLNIFSKIANPPCPPFFKAKKGGRILFLILLFIMPGYAAFTTSPKSYISGDSLIVEFEVSTATDVEVAILDNRDSLVCHLAAGVLGGDTLPPEPLAAGLKQRLFWNGLDDYGRPVSGGPFKARVRLGVHPEFDKSISTRQFPTAWSSIKYGPDSVSSTDAIISMSHPVWTMLPGAGTVSGFTDTLADGTPRIKFYSGLAGLDMTVSDLTDDIVLKGYAGAKIPMITINGITGLLKSPFPTTYYNSTPFIRPTLCDSFYLSNTKVWAYDGEPIFDWDGKYIFHDENGGGGGNWSCNYIYRFLPNGTAAPFTGKTDNIICQDPFDGGDHRGRGMAAGPDGSLYHAHYRYRDDTTEARAFNITLGKANSFLYVAKYDSNGNLINPTHLKIYGNIGQGIRVDPKGNLFLGVRVKPKGMTMPSNVRAIADGDSLNKYSQWYWADEMYGSIVKFPAAGGGIVPDPNGNLRGGWYSEPAKATNMLWMHYGASFQATHTSFRTHCWCYTPRFDVDRFGRVIFPNPFENEFKALDNNGNMIFRIRNSDIVSKVKIGMGHNIQATDKGIYIADWMNNQIVRFNWKADDSATLTLPATASEGISEGLSNEHMIKNSPNPFKPSTEIILSAIPDDGNVTIYNVAGKLIDKLSVRSAHSSSSKVIVQWKGDKQASGLYLISVKVKGKIFKRTMLLTK